MDKIIHIVMICLKTVDMQNKLNFPNVIRVDVIKVDLGYL